jgi:hypothetical protein
VGDPEHQLHDYEPGIAPSGLFWTIPIAASTIQVNPGSGVARLTATDVAVEDYHDFFNAIGGGASTPARVSFDVRWSGGGDRERIRDDSYGFVGEFVSGPAEISFTAVSDGKTYTSDAGEQTSPLPPAVGTERNGIFFH